jgi:hypothetical protein
VIVLGEVMPVEIHSRFFAVLGLLLGALLGFVFSVWMPPRTAIIADLYNPVMWAIAILSFFVLQYGLGVLLNKPCTSREIYFGVLLFPITYTASMLTISILNFLQTVVAAEIPALVLFIASFYIVSPFVSFFAGFDTKALDEATIPAETAFTFDIRHSAVEEEDGLKLLTRIVHGMGLAISLKDAKDNDGLIICRKEKMHIGIIYDFRDRVLTTTFVPFRLVNDVVKEVEDLDAVLDFKAQISGMLYAWMQNNLILRFNEAPPNVKLGFVKVSEGLGPLKTPFTIHMRETIVSFPKNHPYQLALLTTGSVIIVNVMLFILGRLVFK